MAACTINRFTKLPFIDLRWELTIRLYHTSTPNCFIKKGYFDNTKTSFKQNLHTNSITQTIQKCKKTIKQFQRSARFLAPFVYVHILNTTLKNHPSSNAAIFKNALQPAQSIAHQTGLHYRRPGTRSRKIDATPAKVHPTFRRVAKSNCSHDASARR